MGDFFGHCSKKRGRPTLLPMHTLTLSLVLTSMSYAAAIMCVVRHYDRRSISDSIKHTKRAVLAYTTLMVTSAIFYEYLATGASAGLMVLIGAALLSLIRHDEGRAHACSAIVCLVAIEWWIVVEAYEARDPWACIASACALGWCALATDSLFGAEATFLLLFALMYFRRHARLVRALP